MISEKAYRNNIDSNVDAAIGREPGRVDNDEQSQALATDWTGELPQMGGSWRRARGGLARYSRGPLWTPRHPRNRGGADHLSPTCGIARSAFERPRRDRITGPIHRAPDIKGRTVVQGVRSLRLRQ